MKDPLREHWVRKIDAGLQQLDRIPLYGNAPRFDFQKISSSIASHFGIAGLTLELGGCSWREPDRQTEELGSNLLTLAVSLTPLGAKATWIMSRQDVAHLTSWLMNGKAKGRSVSSEILQEGFYRYLALNALDALQGLDPLKDFSLKLDDEGSVAPSENAWCADIKLSFEQRSCWGRLAVPSHLFTAWQKHFSSLRELFSLTPIGKSLEVPICVKTGSVLLSAKEWKLLKPGDFVLLDRGSCDPRNRSGIASLTLGGTPLFHVSVKENKIKLLDYALFYEDTMKNREPGSEIESKTAAGEEGLQNMLPPEEGLSMAVKDLPLFVTVELARMRMTVDELMKLVPGNFLELPIHPEQGVVLTVNGQKVGRAELVHLGEKLGIRILETA